MALQLEIVTPSGLVMSEAVEEVSLPGQLGEFCVLNGHIPFLSGLRPGIVRYISNSKTKHLAVGSGYAEVGTEEKVLVLADQHAFPDDVDGTAAAEELEQAESNMKGGSGQLDADYHELSQRLEWAKARVDLKRLQ